MAKKKPSELTSKEKKKAAPKKDSGIPKKPAGAKAPKSKPERSVLNKSDAILDVLRGEAVKPLSAQQVASRLKVAVKSIRNDLAFLEREGLVLQSAGKIQRYQAASNIGGLVEVPLFVIASTNVLVLRDGNPRAAAVAGALSLAEDATTWVQKIVQIFKSNPTQTFTRKQLLFALNVKDRDVVQTEADKDRFFSFVNAYTRLLDWRVLIRLPLSPGQTDTRLALHPDWEQNLADLLVILS